MKLVAQKILFFQQGSSDKVYEVDLCEVGAGQYVVNYRYGRRGGALRDGTETPSALSRDGAQRVFDKLVASKLTKGYREIAAGTPAQQPAAPASAAPAAKVAPMPAPAGADPVEVAILAALQRGVLHRPPPPGARKAPQPNRSHGFRNRLRAVVPVRVRRPPRPLDRMVWRAGELGLAAATPLLLQLLGTVAPGEVGAHLRHYGVVWALGRCARHRPEAPLEAALRERVLLTLRELTRGTRTHAAVARIAAEALRLVLDPPGQAERARELLASLPPELATVCRSGPAEAVTAALRGHVGEVASRHAVLETLYLIDSEIVRPAVVAVLREAPLRPPVFQHLRHLYKAAEYRRDAQVFGVLAHRIEKERAFCHRTKVYQGHELHTAAGVTVRARDNAALAQLFQGPGAKVAFSRATRTYLRRRTVRTLRRLGQAGDLDFIQMAVGTLLQFTDADAVQVRSASRPRFDRFAPYLAFNFLLYANSPRYAPQRNGRAWRCRGDYFPGGPAPAGREEAFPRLWERRPEGLLHLLSESACHEVHRFAAKAVRACPKLLGALDTDAIIMLLSAPYDETCALGLDLATARHRPDAPDLALVLALAQSSLAAARTLAHGWIRDRRDLYVFAADGGDFLLGLCTCAHPDTRALARDLLRGTALPRPRAQPLIARLVAHLLGLGTEAADAALARDVADTLLWSFSDTLRGISVKVALDLLGHPLKEVQELGGQLLLLQTRPASELPSDVLGKLFDSAHESVRGIGARLLGLMDDAALLGRGEILRDLLLHRLTDLRQSIRPVAARLSTQDGRFGAWLCGQLVTALLQREPETHAGLHRDLLLMLTTELWPAAAALPLSEALRLVAAPSQLAQDLGGRLLLARPAWARELPTPALVRLGSSDVLSVRQAALQLMREIVPRLQGSATELGLGLRLLDARWEDTRRAAAALFEEALTAEHWTPRLLVSVCDSVRPDVQALGQRLITRFFEEPDGPEYLLKLSEHPSGALQLFATNYLDRYAAGHDDRLAALEPYFLRVLSRPNQGRVARRRVLSFLQAEAQRGESPARLVARILGRVSATAAIGDRELMLQTLLQLRRAYPLIEAPIVERPPPLRTGPGKEARGGV